MDNIPEGAIPVDASEQGPPPGAIPVNDPNTAQPPPGSIPVDSDTNVDHSSSSEMLKTFAEGAGRGATFGTSTLAEKAAGVNPEDIEARRQANPITSALGEASGTIGSMFIPGVGEGWLLAKGAKALVPIVNEASTIAKVGRLALRGMLETSGMATGDELSDMFLGEQKPADAVASHIANAGALGLLTGGGTALIGKGLEAAQNANLGNYLDDFAIGLGAASKGPEVVKNTMKMYEVAGLKVPKGLEHGAKFYDETSNKIGQHIADQVSEAAGTVAGAAVGGIPGAVIVREAAKKYLDPYAEKLASKITPTITKKVAVPIMLRAIQLGDATGLSSALNYGTKAAKGAQMINDAVDSIFKVGGSKAINLQEDQNENDKLDDYIKNGGIDQQITDLGNKVDQNYAKGGEVHPQPLATDGVASLYPSQNIMLNAAKSRVSNYLNSVRPLKDPNAMPFDTHHIDPLKEKSYREALTIANKPLMTLQHLQKGNLKLSHVVHMKSMYPELYDHLSKKITDKIMDHRMEEKKPNYRTRQNLSLFLGTSLDSTMTPSSIQAAQSVFVPRAAPQQQQAQESKPKKSTAPLNKVSKDYQTPEQSRAARANKD